MTTPPGVFGLYNLENLPAPRTVAAQGITGSPQLVTGIGLIIAWTFCEAVGASVARYRIHDGTDATGQFLITMSASTNASSNGSCPLPGILFRLGLYAANANGQADITITYIPLLSQP